MLYPSYDQLKLIAPSGNDDILKGLAKFLPLYAPKYDLNTSLRVNHFIAQAAHESAGFKTLTEYASGADYEGRKDLGNTQKGDGIRYKGRGIFQLTGRGNYRQIGANLGLDLENHPELAATIEVSVRTALEFWKVKNLNHFADLDQINAITLRINGGYNGLTSRVAFYNKTKSVMGQGDAKPADDPNNPVLAKYGDISDYVKSLQHLLNVKLKAGLTEDGKYFDKTTEAVKKFQTDNALKVTGNIDQRTLDDINRIAS